MIGIWQPNRIEFLAPGGLSSNHAQIWSSGNSENRCVACHAAGASDPISWVKQAVFGNPHPGEPQYEKCLKCHQSTLGSENTLIAHNLNAETLAELSNQQVGSSGSSSIFASPVNHSGEIACATCHQEHHGANHDLAAMTDNQCQSCHQSQFSSFESGHPEFTSPIGTDDPEIQFDHHTHQAKYFSESQAEFNCQTCHDSDQQGNVMQSKPFETSCAGCHQKKIDASLTQGLPVFSLPLLDLDVLKKNNLDVGEWPELASGSFDGGLPPLMKVLLASDPRAVDAMKYLGKDFDLFDLDLESVSQLKAVQGIAIAIKELMYDLSLQGQAGLVKRLQRIGGQEIPVQQLRAMLGNLSAETFTEAQKVWFPNLDKEISQLRQTENEIPFNSVLSETPGVLPDFPSTRPLPHNNAKDNKNRIQLITFLQQEDSSLLAENPLKKLIGSTRRNPSAERTPSRKTDLPIKGVTPSQTDINPASIKPLKSKSSLVENRPLPPILPLNRSTNVPPASLNPKKTLANRKQDPIPKSQLPPIIPADTRTTPLEDQQVTDLPAVPPMDHSLSRLERSPLRPENGPEIERIANPYVSPRQTSKSTEAPGTNDQNTTRDLPTVDPSQEVQETSQEVQETGQEVQETEVGELAENPISKKMLQKEKATKTRIDPSSPLRGHNPDDPVEHPQAEQIGKPKAKPDGTTPSKSTAKNGGPKSVDVIPTQPTPTPATKNQEKTPSQINESRDESASQPKRQSPGGNNNEDQSQRPSGTDQVVRLSAMERVPLGGWYRDDTVFTIAYKQTGHADPLTVNWYNFVASIPMAAEKPMLANFITNLKKTTSPGLCASCHSHNLTGHQSLQINWKTTYRDPSRREFTRFSHRPHLVQAGTDQCSHCHQLTAESPTIQKADDFLTQKCQSGFKPMAKSNCTQCHNNQSRIQNCTQCHNYHVGGKIEFH